MKYTAYDVNARLIVRLVTDKSLYHFNKLILDYPDINEHVHKPMCDFYVIGHTPTPTPTATPTPTSTPTAMPRNAVMFGTNI